MIFILLLRISIVKHDINNKNMAKVLLLEDNAYMISRLVDLLENEGFETLEAFQVSDAFDLFEKSPDIIVVDLNVPPTGLTEEEREQTKGGILSGWIWLRNYVLNKYPEYKKKVIVYSAYIETLKENYPEEIKGISLIDKGRATPSKVIEVLKNLLKTN